MPSDALYSPVMDYACSSLFFLLVTFSVSDNLDFTNENKISALERHFWYSKYRSLYV
jgi:hypothetical protein